MSDLKTYKVSKNLWLHQYIPYELYRKYSNEKPWYLFGLIDPRLIIADQFLYDRFGEFLINTWHDNGDRNWSGFRTDESPYFSFFSQHSYGRASDKIFLNHKAEEIRQDIRNNYDALYKPLGITCIEKEKSWLHWDVRRLMYNADKLLEV